MARPAPPRAPSCPPRRTRILAFAAALCLFASLLTALTAHGQDESLQAEAQQPKRRRADYVPGEVLVRFRGESAAAAFGAEKGSGDAPALMRADGGPAISVKVERLEGAEMVAGLRLARVRPEETWDAVSALRSRPDVAYAEPNYKRRLFRVPNDPRFLDLWGLRAAGSKHLFEGATGYGIDAERAWNITTGDRGVVVGVVDEGINVSHPDLAANVWKNPAEVPGNGLDDDGNGYADDAHGWDFFNDDASVYDGFGREDHGSHVAGTIGAVGDNGVGVVGVNWRVSLMSLKVLGGVGEVSSFTTVAHTIRAFNYARRMRELWESSGGAKGANVRVLNNSYGGFDDSAAEFDAVRALGDAGILFVAAAGNEGRSNDTFPAFPASYDAPNVISVAGGGSRDNLLNYTNFGQQSVHLSAPGFAVLSTTSLGYDFYQGTSMASPHVAGTAALICAAHPDIPLRRLRDLLLLNGDPYPAHEGMTMTRRRLNAFKSLRAAAEADAAPPARIDDLRLVSQQGRRLVLAWTSPGDDGSLAGTAALYEIRFTPKLPATEAEFMTGHPLYAPLPEGAGRAQGAAVTLPLRHASGFVTIRALDNVGNRGELASVPVSVAPQEADPYLVMDSDPEPLSTGGTGVTAGDDRYREEYPLPFAFPIFGRWVRHVDVSTNGALYFELPPDYRRPPVTYRGVLIDAEPTTRALKRYFMIAPLWDDLRMDRNPSQAVWAVTPDADRIIFRWDGVTFDTRLEAGGTRGEHPVHFEVELRRDGTIQMRYGEGNTRVFPVVGISGGTPDADAGYVVASHTSEYALKDLTRARTLTFTPRRAPRPTSSDLRLRVINDSGRVTEGGQINYSFLIDTLGPDAADNVTFSYPLPPATTFVTHDTQSSLFPEIRCSVPAAGATGRINCNLGRVGEFYHTRIKAVLVTLQARAPLGSTLTGAASVAHAAADPSAANNTVATSTVIATNVIDAPQFFVRQHYLDFLNREPDAGGLSFWSKGITGCGANQQCITVKRVDTSAAFFLSIEFQETGYLAYRFYKAAYGDATSPGVAGTVPVIRLEEFLPDTRRIGEGVVVGTPGWAEKLEANKQSFALEFVGRERFTTAFPASLTPAQFVDRLNQRAGSVLTAQERSQLIQQLTANNTAAGRAAALRAVAENELLRRREFNRAFVLMQYYGYLRRDPDDGGAQNFGGWRFWLDKLEDFGGDYRAAEMVRAFIESSEYRRRFGQ